MKHAYVATNTIDAVSKIYSIAQSTNFMLIMNCIDLDVYDVILQYINKFCTRYTL